MSDIAEVRELISSGPWQAARYEASGCEVAMTYCDAHGIPRFAGGSGSGSGYGYGYGYGDGYGSGYGSGYGYGGEP